MTRLWIIAFTLTATLLPPCTAAQDAAAQDAAAQDAAAIAEIQAAWDQRRTAVQSLSVLWRIDDVRALGGADVPSDLPIQSPTSILQLYGNMSRLEKQSPRFDKELGADGKGDWRTTTTTMTFQPPNVWRQLVNPNKAGIAPSAMTVPPIAVTQNAINRDCPMKVWFRGTMTPALDGAFYVAWNICNEEAYRFDEPHCETISAKHSEYIWTMALDTEIGFLPVRLRQYRGGCDRLCGARLGD